MKDKIQKYGFPALLIFLTVILMIVFKQKGNVIESGTNSALDFFTQNLKPLFAETKITNEDVINFAFNRNLPVNAERNRVISFSEDFDDNDIIEFKDGYVKKNTNNYERLVNFLELNKRQKTELDSILNSYKSDLNSYLFVGDNRTIAIDPKIALVRDLIMHDLMLFVEKVKLEKTQKKGQPPTLSKIKPLPLAPELRKLIDSEAKRNFVFIGNDTSFSADLVVKKNKLDKELKIYDSDSATNGITKFSMKDFVSPGIKHFGIQMHKIPGVHVEISNDRNGSDRIVIAGDSLPGVSVIEMKELKKAMEELTRKFTTFTYSSDSNDGAVSVAIKFGSDNSDSGKLKFQFNVSELRNIITTGIKMSIRSESDWEQFGIKIDSLANKFVTFPDDSSFDKGKKTKK